MLAFSKKRKKQVMVCQVSHATCQVSSVAFHKSLVNNAMPHTEIAQSYSHLIERNLVLVKLNSNTLNGIQTPNLGVKWQ